MLNKRAGIWCLAAGFVTLQYGFAATLEATYLFNNSLAAQQAGAPALVAVDPLGVATFTTDTVLGQSRTVYSYGGTNSPPSSQGGLTLNTASLLTTANSYSVEILFEFTQNVNAWRRILDVANRQSDNGFYVDPSNHLDIFPVVGSSDTFTNNAYHDVVLTDNNGIDKAYLDGTLELTTASITVMDNVNNQLNFFLDNLVGGGQGEWSAGKVAAIQVWDGALNDSEVAALEPFETGGVPEPGTWATLGIGLAGVLALRFRKV